MNNLKKRVIFQFTDDNNASKVFLSVTSKQHEVSFVIDTLDDLQV